jgi:hypothetical protein
MSQHDMDRAEARERLDTLADELGMPLAELLARDPVWIHEQLAAYHLRTARALQQRAYARFGVRIPLDDDDEGADDADEPRIEADCP